MTRLFLLAFLLTLSAPPAAQDAPAPASPSIDAGLPAELAAWRSPSVPSGALHPGVAVRIPLQPIAALQAAVPPHTARDGGATTGARLDLEIAAAGTYRIALDHGAWIDLVRDGQALRPAAHGPGPACSSIHRIVEFTLAPGRYVIQLSGTTAAAARLLVLPR